MMVVSQLTPAFFNAASEKVDVADMDADAKFDPLILRHVGILLGHAVLDFHAHAHCIYCAGELDQQAVAGSLDDASTMGSDGGINKGLSDSLQPRQRAFLVEPIRRLYPATSAASTAANRRSTRSSVNEAPGLVETKHGLSKHVGRLSG